MGELSRSRRTAVSAEASFPGARDGAAHAAWRYSVDAPVAKIGDEEIARLVHRYTGLIITEGSYSPCHGADHAVCRYLTDDKEKCVGDEDIARPVRRNTRRHEWGRSRLNAVFTEAVRPVACYRADHTVGRHFTDSEIARIRDEKIVGPVYRHAPR